MKLDQHYWENRYTSGTAAWDLGHISLPLKTIIDKIENKNLRILIPGAGNAHEALYLVEKGFTNITVLDLAIQPLLQLEKSLKNKDTVRIIQQNFFEHNDSYDLILEQTFFCAIEPRLRESYIKKSYELLIPDGCIEGVLFDFDLKRNEPPYSGTIDEYINIFQKKFEIITLTRCLNSEISRKGKELIIKLKKNNE